MMASPAVFDADIFAGMNYVAEIVSLENHRSLARQSAMRSRAR